MKSSQIISSLDDLKSFTQQFVSHIQIPQLILLQGPLGVGKTQWVRFLSESLGVERDICSPSFSLINIYQSPKVKIAHIDLFRLKDKEDLESTGIWDVFLDSQIVIVEWSDLFSIEWPKSWNQISIGFKFCENKELRQMEWEKL